MMKRYKIIISIVFIFIFYSFSAFGEDGFDFRKVKWGMSKKEVIKSESKNKLISNEKNQLMFKDNIFNHPALVSYTFNNNKLSGAIIVITEFNDADQIVDLFLESKKMLQDKYKEIPSKDEASAEFESNRSKIKLIGANPNNKLQLWFLYSDKEYLKSIEKNKEDKFNNDKSKF